MLVLIGKLCVYFIRHDKYVMSQDHLRFYTSNAGLKELRQEVCNYMRRSQGIDYDPLKEVLITVGGSLGKGRINIFVLSVMASSSSRAVRGN